MHLYNVLKIYLFTNVGNELNSRRTADLHTTAHLMKETAEHELRFYSCCA